MSSINLIESKGVLRNNWNAEVEDYVIGCEWADEGNILLVGNVAGGVSALEGETEIFYGTKVKPMMEIYLQSV